MKKFLFQYYFRSYNHKRVKTLYRGFIIFNKFAFLLKHKSDNLHIQEVLAADKRMGLITFVI